MIFSKKLNFAATWLLIACFSRDSMAAEKAPIFEREKLNTQQLSEFIYGDELEEKLMPVFLLGAVHRPGIYHVPNNTSLTTLLSIAGGTMENSLLDSVTIRNERAGKIDKVDFEALLSGSGKSPVLKGEDTVFIPTVKPAISSNAVLAVTISATLLAAVLTGLLIRKEL